MISRADSRLISNGEERRLLAHYSLDESSFLGEGTEARVYRLDSERVLKLYHNVRRNHMLKTLKEFYENLDSSRLSFQIPRILEIQEQGDLLAVVEKHIPGSTLADSRPIYDSDSLQKLYVNAVAELGKIELKAPLRRFMLFDPDHISSDRTNDWHGFLYALLEKKMASVASYLKADIPEFPQLASSLLRFFKSPYSGDLKVVHGDIYPGNILMTMDGNVSGIIDFGTFTMVGDPLLDVATSWGFFGMYEQNRALIRDKLLTKVLDCHGEQWRTTIYRYLQVYAILSCDLYPEETCSIRETGHYLWAAEILSNKRYQNH